LGCGIGDVAWKEIEVLKSAERWARGALSLPARRRGAPRGTTRAAHLVTQHLAHRNLRCGFRCGDWI